MSMSTQYCIAHYPSAEKRWTISAQFFFTLVYCVPYCLPHLRHLDLEIWLLTLYILLCVVWFGVSIKLVNIWIGFGLMIIILYFHSGWLAPREATAHCVVWQYQQTIYKHTGMPPPKKTWSSVITLSIMSLKPLNIIFTKKSNILIADISI